jgi:MYXO-CTERM domain-containing protein
LELVVVNGNHLVKLAVAAGIFFVPARRADAQLYSIAQSAAPFTPLAGGTAISFTDDDDGGANIPIGFPFTYYGQTFTHLNVGVNGHAWFALPCMDDTVCGSFDTCDETLHVCVADSSDNIPDLPMPNNDEPNGLLAPWWDDLELAATSQVLAEVLGTTPNRRLVIEWRNVRHFTTGGPSTSAANFQLELLESGQIRYRYGPTTAGNSTWEGSIGSEDVAGTTAVVPSFTCANSAANPCNFAFLTGLNGQMLETSIVGIELVPGLRGPPGSDPGARVPFNVQVRNIGSRTTTTGFAADLYFSTDPAISTTADIFLGRLSFAVIAAGQTRSATLTANIPANLTPGRYYVGALIDPLNTVPERIETNNLAVVPFSIGPELSLTVSGGPSTGPGETFEVTLMISSTGTPLAQSGYAIYFSADQIFDRSDVRIATGTVALNRMASIEARIPAIVPEGILPGDYYLIAIIDPGERIAEVDEANNAAVSSGTTEIVGPDVVAVELSGSTAAFRGEMYRARATIRNAGGASARAFYYSFHLSQNQLITISDPLLGELGPIDLAPGQTINVEHTFVVSTTIAAGNYFLGIIADSTSQILEEQESNNIKRLQTPVVVRDPAPDFVMAEIRLPSNGAAGEALTVERTFVNAGNATGTFGYELYLSSDNVVDPAVDPKVGEGRVTLTRFEEQTGVDLARLPSALSSGRYYIGYLLDVGDVVAELDEMNNVAISAGSIPVEAGQLTIVTRALPPGTVGLPYEFDLAARGGTGQYTWSIVSGMLPPGIAFSTMTGRLSGTPERESSSLVVFSVNDGSSTAELGLNFVVGEPTVELEIITRAIPPAFVARPFQFPMTAIGGVPPYQWIATGMMPSGLTLSPEGVISGMGSAPASASISFQVRDAVGSSYDRVVTVRVVSNEDVLRFSNDVLADGIVGKQYDDKLRVVTNSGDPPYVFTLSDGQLPPGLEIVDDKVTGIPTRVGDYVFAVRVTDLRGDFDVNRFTLSIEPDEGVRFVTTSLPPATRGTAYVDEMGAPVKVKAIASSAMGAITLRRISGELPPGLMMSEDGIISGTPTASGVFSFIAEASDSLGEQDFRALAIVVDEPVVEPPPPPKEEGCGCETTHKSGPGSFALAIVLFALVLVRRRSWLAIVALGLLPASASAQMVPYFYQDTTAPYVARTGGMPLAFSSQDDGSATINLPFPFRFYANNYTTAEVSTNGYLTFGGDGSSLGNTSFPDPEDPNDIIALFWDDLYGPTGSMHVEGMAPSRIVIIQWANVHHFGNRSANANFQLWLYEGQAGRFELRYGPSMGLGSGSFDASVGFENSTASQGHVFLPCTSSCNEADLTALNGRVFGALMDAGEDVVAASVMAAPRVYAGMPVAVSATLQSFHQNPLGPFVYQYHIVPVGESRPNNPVFTSNATTLMPYQTLMLMDDVTFPVSTPPGRYRVALVADAQSQISEPDETNNVVFSGDVIVGERRPDFTVNMFSASPLVAAPGDMITVRTPIRNAGNLDSPPTEWWVVLSPNRVISVDDRQVFTGTISIALLATETREVRVPLPSDLVPGRYYAGVIVDPMDRVRELNEVNNTGASTEPVAVGVGFLEIATESLPAGYVGVDYSAFLSAAGGDGTYRWEIVSGMLPPGLNLLSSSGEIRGRPLDPAATMITLGVTSGNLTAMKELDLLINEVGGPLTIVTRELLPGIVGQSYPPLGLGETPAQGQRIRVVNATGTVAFSLTGAAPPGLELDSNGYLHGTPVQRGVFDLPIAARDQTQSATRTIPLTVVEPGRLALIAELLPDAVLEEEYRHQLQVVGGSGTATATFRLGMDDVLPDGLALTESGLIVGTPARIGTWHFAVVASEGTSPSAPEDTANFTLVVKPDASFGITPTSLPVAVLGAPYDAVLDARGGNAPFVWSLIMEGELPRGLRFEIETAADRQRMHFKGTPEIIPTQGGGAVSFVVRVEDVLGRRADQPMAIRVVAPPTQPPPPPEEGCGCTAVSGDERPGLWISLFGLMFLFARRVRRWGR